MADEASTLKPKTLKRKNVKGLMLKAEPRVAAPAPAAQADDDDSSNNLNSRLGALEIGVEFKLDLRAEDLTVMNELGAGNGGTVSKVMHQTLKTIMAKKVIHIDAKPKVRKQIVRELHIMHECHSPYIVSFYGAFLNEGDVVMCMEYMDCGSLDNIAKKIGPIRIDVLGKIAEAVVEGLHYLYNEHKILHRDIKPSNILVNSRGQIKLCDFGVSGELINSIANTFVGTSTYMAPERIKGAQYSVKSDVWSLGLSLLELAIGRFPFDADGSSAGTRASAGPMGILDLLQKIVNEPAPKLPKNAAFPRSLELMIEHCLIKDPDLRPSPEDLLSEPFMRSAKATNVDLEGWACEVMEKLTGKPHQRSRASVLMQGPQRESPAPPRPISRIDGPAPPPPRRPSVPTSVESSTRRPATTAESSSRRSTPPVEPSTRRPVAPMDQSTLRPTLPIEAGSGALNERRERAVPFPARSSSVARSSPTTESGSVSARSSAAMTPPPPRMGSPSSRSSAGMAPPPPRTASPSARNTSAMAPPPQLGSRNSPAMSPPPHSGPGSARSSPGMAPPLLGRPPIQKSYTERETTSSIEAQREREKLEREREREQKRAYAYRQGTIGIAFEGGTAAPALPAKEGEQLSEMREKRRPPPMSTMSSNNSTAGSASGWDRNR